MRLTAFSEKCKCKCLSNTIALQCTTRRPCPRLRTDRLPSKCIRYTYAHMRTLMLLTLLCAGTDSAASASSPLSFCMMFFVHRVTACPPGLSPRTSLSRRSHLRHPNGLRHGSGLEPDCAGASPADEASPTDGAPPTRLHDFSAWKRVQARRAARQTSVLMLPCRWHVFK
jgi:hypothetical protein